MFSHRSFTHITSRITLLVVFLFIHFKILVYGLILLLMFSAIVFLVYNMLFKF